VPAGAAAGFSGRMPCAELADSIVQTAREFLERAMEMAAKARPEWGARVVYGDTDSMFVELRGKSRAEAWRIGREIAEAVTRAVPAPMELELEKVPLPNASLPPRFAYSVWHPSHRTLSAGVPTEHLRDKEALRGIRVRGGGAGVGGAGRQRDRNGAARPVSASGAHAGALPAHPLRDQRPLKGAKVPRECVDRGRHCAR